MALAFMAVIWVSPFGWLFSNAFDTASVGRLAIWPQSLRHRQFHRRDRAAMPGGMFLNSLLIAAGTATISVVVGALLPPIRCRACACRARTLCSGRWCCCACCLRPACWCRSTSRRSERGLLNQFGVMLALTILNLPFTLLLLKNFFDTVPIELEEAAYVEGASLWQIVTRIVLPMSRAGPGGGLVLQLHRRLERVPAAADLLARARRASRCRSASMRPSAGWAPSTTGSSPPSRSSMRRRRSACISCCGET
jgi:multiple sugar transport system permease protein